MSNLPFGTVTFLFTDIENSTQLWEQSPEAMQAALAQHDAILREAVEANHGYIVKTRGDGVHAAFEKAIDGIKSSRQAQTNLQSAFIHSPYSFPLKARMGLHTGEAELRDGDYFGQTLNRAARIMEVAYGGQILLSAVTAALVRDALNLDTGLLDLGEHRLKHLNRPEIIFQLTAPGLPADFPPLKSFNTLTSNLPVQLTSFVGRERELHEAKEKLLPSSKGKSPLNRRPELVEGLSKGAGDEGARLLTLIGPGGTGKTRLSLQLGASLLQDFKDGVWLAELAALSDPSHVLQTIASVLNVREQPGMPLHQLVLDFLRDKQLLLILDNCEHLVETCAQLAEDLLSNAPYIRILASSREALGIRGETIYRVPSLSLPGQTGLTREEILGYESVQLFVERGTAANPNFRLADHNASSVAQICQRLDGIPLAIELAASRLRVFPPEQIAARLDDRFKLLTGGSRTALPRQQTLRALIDWSYDLLTPEEQALFRRLSVFSGGWTYETGEALCGDVHYLDDLAQLINKSLVVQDEGEAPRYRFLETIRQYARDKLLESGEGREYRDRHLNYFLSLAETAGPNIQGSDSLRWAEKLRSEYDNLRVALEWGLSGNLEAALRIVGALPYFWIMQGYSVEGRRWAVEALEQAQSTLLPDDEREVVQLNSRANAYLALSILATDLGDNQTVCPAASQSIALAHRSGDKHVLSHAMAYLASGKANLGQMEEAFELAQEALVLARECGNAFALAFSHTTMAEVMAMAKQDYAGARVYSQEALRLAKAGGYRWGYAMTVFGLGFMARTLGEYDQAREQFKACLPVFLEIGDKHRLNMIQSELGHIEREQGHFQQAIQIYRETILEWKRLGHRAAIAHQLECFAFIAKGQAQVERAVKLLGAAQALRERINIAMTPPEQVEYGRQVADLQAYLDKHKFSSLWAEGGMMAMEQAVQFALEEAGA